jgi:hypothetical protein
MKKFTSFIAIFFSLSVLNALKAQDTDLLKLVEDTKSKKEIVKNAFKSTRVINGHSMEF